MSRIYKLHQVMNNAIEKEDRGKNMEEILQIPKCKFTGDTKAWEWNGRDHLYCPYTWEKECRKCTREKARRQKYLFDTYGPPEFREEKGIIDDEVIIPEDFIIISKR